MALVDDMNLMAVNDTFQSPGHQPPPPSRVEDFPKRLFCDWSTVDQNPGATSKSRRPKPVSAGQQEKLSSGLARCIGMLRGDVS